MNKHKKIGLALSGGGYRGAAHIGALKALEELNIIPDIISGTSAGSVVGTLYAAGLHWDEIYSFFKEIEIISFKNYSFQKAGFLDSSKFIPLFKEVLPEDNFSCLQRSMFISATDLLEAKTQYFHEGEIIRPLLASCAIPGIFSPVPLNNTLLCDGGVINNLPTEPILPICDFIIGINLSPLQTKTVHDLRSTRSIMERAFAIIRKTQSEKNFKDCDVLISPKDLFSFNILSKNNLAEIFEAGYAEATKQLTNYMKENNI